MTKEKKLKVLAKIEVPPEIEDDVADSIRKIYERDGTLTPIAVVEEARDNPDSPLHSKFDWDVEKAAMEHWINTARILIRNVKVVVRTEHISFKPLVRPAPEFIRDPSAGTRQQGYIRVSDLRTDKDRSADAILSEIERADGCIQRAISIGYELGLDVVLRDVEKALERARKVVKEKSS